MKILVLGHNAATHLIVQKLLANSKITKLYHVEPAKHIETTERYIPLRIGDPTKTLLKFIETTEIDMVIGIYHRWQLWQELRDLLDSKNIPTFMPTRTIGMLEWSKQLGKELFARAGVPTANFKSYTVTTLLEDFNNLQTPYVLKFEKVWRAGRQTIIVNNSNKEEVHTMLTQEPGEYECIVEDYIEGVKEFSFHALCNSINWCYLGSARDYKKRYEGDVGHNTVGMGSYRIGAVDPLVHTYVDKILAELKRQNIIYQGFMYLGIMIDKNGKPWILEMNTRPGDPEIQSILPCIKNDLLELLQTTVENKTFPSIEFIEQEVVTIRLVNKIYEMGFHDTIMPEYGNPDMIQIAHNSYQDLLHSTLTTTAPTRKEASDRLYNFLKTVDTGDYTYRTDIGYLD
jgi:phosphoribosylamine--glycine ligase